MPISFRQSCGALSACRVTQICRRMVLALCLALLGIGTIWTFRPTYSGSTLVLYAAVGYAPQVVSAFMKQTGIPVTVINMSTGPLLARVSAEGHRASWSLVWFDGNAAATALDQSGLLAHNTTPALPWTPLGQVAVARRRRLHPHRRHAGRRVLGPQKPGGSAARLEHAARPRRGTKIRPVQPAAFRSRLRRLPARSPRQ